MRFHDGTSLCAVGSPLDLTTAGVVFYEVRIEDACFNASFGFGRNLFDRGIDDCLEGVDKDPFAFATPAQNWNAGDVQGHTWCTRLPHRAPSTRCTADLVHHV